MIGQSEIDARYEEYKTRVERVNRDGWKWEAAARGSRTRPGTIVVTQVRRAIGNAVVRAGVWFQGAPIRESADSLNPGYTMDLSR